MDLLDSSFSCDDLGFDPLVSSAHIEQQEVFTPTAEPLLPSPAEIDFFFDPPSTPERPAELPSSLVNFAPSTPFALKPLLLSSTLNRPTFSSSAVRNPSPLKQVFSGGHDSLGLGSDLPGVTANGRLEGWEEEGTPVKRAPKKWALVSKAKENRARSRSPVKELEQAEPQDPDSSTIVLPVEEYSLLLNEQASFLNTSRDTDITLSFPLSEIQEEPSDDSIGDMRNLLSGLHQSTIGGPSPFLPPPRQLPAGPTREAEDERSLLACSTASYRKYRESPARPRMVSLVEDWGEDEEAMTLVKGGRKSDGSRSGTESEGSGDVGMLFRNWSGEEMATGEILGQTPPTGVVRTEPTLTFELGLVSPILPTKSLSTSTSTLSSSTTTLFSSSSSSSTIAPSSTSTAASIPLPSSPPRPSAAIVVLSPKTFFTTIQKNEVRSLERVAVGSPRKVVAASGSEEALDLISLGELEAPLSLPIPVVTELFAAPTPAPSAKVVEQVVVAKSRAESGTERLRKKLEELKSKKTSVVVPVVARPGLSTPLARQRTVSSQIFASHAKGPVHAIFDDEDDSVVFGAAANEANEFVDSAPTPAAPRRTIVRSNSMEKVELPTRELKVPGSARKETGLMLRDVGVLESARKETTRERLDRAKEERARRESARSPVKKAMTTSASCDSFSTRSLVDAGAAAKLSSSTSRLPSGGLAPPRPRTTISATSSSRLPPPSSKPIPSIADALAHKPASSLASRYRFNPAVPRPAPSTSTSLPPLKPSSRIASARPPITTTRSLSPSKSSTSLSPSKPAGARTEPAGIKRPTTGMQVPRARVPLGGIQAPSGERGSGIGKLAGVGRSGILAPRK